MTLKRTAAAILAAATAAASVSVCAYAQDATLDFKYENVASADGYDDEAMAVVRHYGGDASQAKDAIEGILAADSIITVDFGENPIDENTLPKFTLYNFSEDGSKLIEKYSYDRHTHPGRLCYSWYFEGVNEEITVTVPQGKIDGIDYGVCGSGLTSVFGNKISGNLIKQLYEENLAEAIDGGLDQNTEEELEELKNLPTFDGYDAVELSVNVGNLVYSGMFLTDSYAKKHAAAPDTDAPEATEAPAATDAPEATDAPDSETQDSDTEPAVGDCDGDGSGDGNASADDGSDDNPGTGVAVAVAPAILAAGALAAAAVIRKRK